MNQVIFKEVMISDLENKSACIINFSDGKNLLTSNSNHVGKSLICKSLFYVLGAETFFSDTWQLVDSLYWLKFDLDGKEYKIVRKNSMFTIYEPNGNVVHLFKVKNFSQYINKLFNLDIKLVAKDDNKTIISSSPVFMYLPYYIDQENGWTPETISFDNLKQFSRPQRTASLFYHLGCYGVDYVEKKLRHKQLCDEQVKDERELQDCERIVFYLQDLINRIGDIVANENELNEKIRLNKSNLNFLLSKMDKLKRDIIKLEHEKALAIHTKEKIEGFLKKEKKQSKAVKDVHCPKCGYEFSLDFKERFEREYLLENINSELIEASELICKCKDKLEKKNSEYVETRKALVLLEKAISSDENLYDNYIKMKSAKALIQENSVRIGDLAVTKDKRAKQIKSLSKELREYEKRANTAEDIYVKYLSKLFALLNIDSKEVRAIEYSIGDIISASGAYKDRVILAKYYAFLLTKAKLASDIIGFPLVIDSPRGAEQDKENARIIMDFILSEVTLNNQVIVSTIDGYEYISGNEEVNVISLHNEKHTLLDKETYMNHEYEIIKAVINLSD